MNGWKEYRLGDFIELKHGYAFNGTGITDLPCENILVTPGNFHIGGGFKNSKFKYFKGNFPEEYILSEGDLVVTMTDLSQETDTLGYSAKIPKHETSRFLHNQRIGLVQFKTEEVNKDFIYWLMRTREYQGFIVGSASGTSIMHTSPTRIKEYSFQLPPFPVQKAIAETLNSIDNKISLLHRQKKTLQTFSELLFKQWFILEADDNWEEKPLDSIAHYLNGLALQKFPIDSDNNFLNVIKIRELRQGITGNTEKCSNNIPAQYIIKDGDILFSWSGSLEVVIWHDGIGALNQHLFKVSSDKYPKWFYYLATKYHLPEFRNIAYTKSTTVGHIQKHHLSEAIISIPPDDLFQKYGKAISPLIEKITHNNAQIKTLNHLRETLLPKLMSGEVRVTV